MIGVGGIGMSGLARLFLHEGKIVSGSDRSASPITEALAREGVQVAIEQRAENVPTNADIVIYTEAMPHDHEEMVAARTLGVPMVNYFEALGMIANEYYLIAVSGTHGKTTTTAMLIDILEDGGLDPTAIVGSLRTKTHSNFRAGKSKYFLVEACEYKEDFLHLAPDVLVITNVEHEHVDYYPDLAAVQRAFHTLAEKVPAEGVIICNVADPALAPVIADIAAHVVDYRPLVDLTMPLRIPGIHNRMNAAAARAVGMFLSLDPIQTDASLASFAGTWRRFEYRGELNGAIIYDDYAHHPSEIRATIAGARELYPERILTVIFQSHTYSRTAELFDDFVAALALADHVYMIPIYAAREENTSGVSSEQLVAALAKKGINARYFPTHEAVVSHVKSVVGASDVVVVMGAGDVTRVSDDLLKD